MVGAGRQDVARRQRMDRADPLDAARNVVRHIVGVEVLAQHAVDPEHDLQVLRVCNLVGGHEVGADRRKGLARLHLEEAVVRGHEAARRAVDEVDVAEDVAHRVLGTDLVGVLADDDSDLGLALEDRRRDVGQDHRVAGADDRARRLVEGVDRRGLLQRAVFHVVDGHAVDVARLRQRRADADFRDGHARPARDRLLQARAVGIEPLDQAVDQVVRAGVRDLLHLRRHVDHGGVVLENAELEIIEIEQLHSDLPSAMRV